MSWQIGQDIFYFYNVYFLVFLPIKLNKMTKNQKYLTIIFAIIFSLGLYDYLSHFEENRQKVAMLDPNYIPEDTIKTQKKSSKKTYADVDVKQLIDELTEERTIINYVKKYHELPGYYIKKSEARKYGWNPSQGNLCEVLPGKAIGGDKFSNREGKLPKNQQYYEADVNYRCGKRNADRIVFTKKGEVWLTKDHYKTFIKI